MVETGQLTPSTQNTAADSARPADSAPVLRVAGLPEDYRTVFLLKDVDGLSNEEIAGALDLTVPAVKSRLHRARLALREKLGEFFGE